MKKILTFLFLSVLIMSCGGESENTSVEGVIDSGDLSAIREKRNEIVASQQKAANQLKELDQAIAKLDTTKKFPLVTTIKAKDTLFNHYLELQGNVETKKNIVLYPEFSGTLTRLYVKEGQKVNRGQLLARIDDGGLGQQLAQMEVQAALAKTTFERQEKLWEQKIGSEIQFLQAKTNYEAQQNAIKQMKSQLGKTTINAPFSGVIDDIMAEQGSVVAAGQTAVIRIINLKDMYIETEVPESYITSISEGKEVKVHFPVLNKSIDTKVRQAGNYINPNNRSFTVEIEVPNKEGIIKPNLTARVQLNDYTNEKAILIPQSIISENSEGDQYVYVVEGSDEAATAKAKRTFVQTGKTQEDYIEILEGISDGDQLISEGARSVKDGQEVEIIK